MREMIRRVCKYTFGVWILGICFAAGSGMPNEIDLAVLRTVDDPEARAALEEKCIELVTAKGEISFTVRYRAFGILEVIGTERSIAPLTVLLRDRERGHSARRVLEKLPGEAADKALLEALADTTGDLRLGIMATLGYRRTAGAEGSLGGLLEETDPATVAGAAAALGRIGSPEALVALRRRLDEIDDEGLKLDLYRAILSGAERLAKDGDLNTALTAYRPLIESGRPAHIRAGAFRGTLSVQPLIAPDLAYAMIHSDDQLLRREAIVTLFEMDSGELARRLIDDFDHFLDESKVLFLSLFAEWGDPATLATVNRSLLDPNAEVRRAAIRAVDLFGDTTSIEPLGRLLGETDDRAEQRGAIESLRRIDAPGMNMELIAYLAKAPLPVRSHIMTVLAQRNAVEAVEAMIAQVDHQANRVAAFRALGELTRPEHLPTMLELLMELNGETGRREAINAVVSLCQRSARENTGPKVIRALDTAPDAEAKVSLMRVLSHLGGESAFEAVLRNLDHEDRRIYNGALQALADWPDDRAVDVLVRLSGEATEVSHRMLALRGAVRLLRQMDSSSPETVGRYVTLSANERNARELMLIFSGLAEVVHPTALQLLEPYLDDKDVGEEAQIAFRRVSEALTLDPKATLRSGREAIPDAVGVTTPVE